MTLRAHIFGNDNPWKRNNIPGKQYLWETISLGNNIPGKETISPENNVHDNRDTEVCRLVEGAKAEFTQQ
jgi:hypothetical protein